MRAYRPRQHLATAFRPRSWYVPKAPPLRVALKRLFSAVSPSLGATTPSYPEHVAWIAAMEAIMARMVPARPPARRYSGPPGAAR